MGEFSTQNLANTVWAMVRVELQEEIRAQVKDWEVKSMEADDDGHMVRIAYAIIKPKRYRNLADP